MIWRLFIMGILFCGGLTTGYADDKKVSTGDNKTNEMMVAVQEKLKEIHTCTAHLATVFKLMGEEIEDDVSATFQTPDLVRLTLMHEGKEVPTMVVEGGVLWVYDPAEQLVTKFNRVRIFRETQKEVDAYVPDPLRPFRGLQWETIRYMGEEKQGEDLFQVFEATPEANLLSVQLPVTLAKVRLSIHAKDGLIRTVQVFDETGAEIVVRRFSQVKSNPKLAARLFEFVIPAGVHVFDATDDTIVLLK